jgi:DNA repair protein SbcC/Rad50
MQELLHTYDNTLSLNSYKASLIKESKNLAAIIKRFSLLGGFITARENEDIDAIYLRIKALSEAFQTYFRQLLKEREKSLLMTKNGQIAKDAERELEHKKPMIKRLQLAFSTISDIIDRSEKQEFLQTFIEDNAKEIGYVFSKIHSPHEFTDIIFEEKRIMLKRANSKQTHGLSKISSGQRSALALSIFLSLNRKLDKGPNVLLFDDPVVFTDDLNILTFLDYLREQLINENRQIFFATANGKLASLFSKKFGFLGDEDFARVRLERSV